MLMGHTESVSRYNVVMNFFRRCWIVLLAVFIIGCGILGYASGVSCRLDRSWTALTLGQAVLAAIGSPMPLRMTSVDPQSALTTDTSKASAYGAMGNWCPLCTQYCAQLDPDAYICFASGEVGTVFNTCCVDVTGKVHDYQKKWKVALVELGGHWHLRSCDHMLLCRCCMPDCANVETETLCTHTVVEGSFVLPKVNSITFFNIFDRLWAGNLVR